MRLGGSPPRQTATDLAGTLPAPDVCDLAYARLVEDACAREYHNRSEPRKLTIGPHYQ